MGGAERGKFERYGGQSHSSAPDLFLETDIQGVMMS